MGCGYWAKFALLGLLTSAAGVRDATAQSTDIPLQLVQSSGGVRLTINIGIGGGNPRPYLFDTGSAPFNAFYSPTAFGSVPSYMSASTALFPNGLPTGVNYSYGSGYTYTGNFVGVPSLTFYPTSSVPANSPTGVTLNAITPSGTPSAFIMNAIYNRSGHGRSGPMAGPTEGIPGVFGGLYGIFGAGDFADTAKGHDPGIPGVTPNTSKAAYGSVLGQAVIPGTTSGYVVAANGQPLAGLQTGTSVNPGAYANGTQIGQTVTSCSPCVMLGLTPALLAQFKPMNAIAWDTPTRPFPNSNATGSTEFGINMNFSTAGAGQHTVSWTGSTLLDSGTPYYNLHIETVAHSYTLNQGATLTISGTTSRALPLNITAFKKGAFPYSAPYSVSVGNGSNLNTIGIGFFLQNSVLFNLSGQAVAYTPNFVTDTNIVTTGTAPLVVGSNSVPLGLAGIISGTGGVSITPGGTATLSGANTYTGATSINGGLLALAGPGIIANSSGISVGAGGTFDISETTAGTAIKSLSGDATGLVSLGGQTLTLTVANGTFAGRISGTGGLGVAGGHEVLSGTNTYTGPTTIGANIAGTLATLEVDGSIAATSNVAVNAGGTLSGTGVVDPTTTTITAGGTLAPGNPANRTGMLKISGNLVFNAGSFYGIGLTPSQHALTTVTGTAAINGGTVTLGPAPNLGAFYDASKFAILSSGDRLTGAFNPAVGFNGVVQLTTTPTLSYDAHDVYLSYGPSAVDLATPPGAGQNQQNVINTINSKILSGTALPSGLQNLGTLSVPSYLSALTQVNGEITVDGELAAFQLTDEFLNVMLDPFVDGRLGSGGGIGGKAMAFAPDEAASLPPDVALAYAGVLKAPPVVFDQRWTAWGASYGGGNWTNGNAATGSSNINAQTYGFAAGMDYHYAPDTIFGFALGGGGTNWGIASGGTGRSDAFQAGIYGMTRSGPAYLAGALAFANHWMTTNRAASGDALTASFDAQSYGARVEGGYRYAVLPTLGVTPYAALRAQDFHTPGFSESDLGGDGLGLSDASMNTTDVRSELGARFDNPEVIAGMPLLLRARLAWAHDWVSDPSVNAAFEALPGTNFIVYGAPMPENAALTSAGAELFITPRLTFLAKFDGEFAPGSQTYAGTGTLRYIW